MNLTKPVKVRTILFTEACPLACRYCFLKDSKTFGTAPAMTKSEVEKTVEKYDKEDNVDVVITRLLFTGGEPFLYWDWIKEIIEKYGHRFQYSFNTSGYMFTEEILEFLSKYDVNFVLSVDGNEKLTNYLRPVINNPYKVGYMRKLKEILPTLLYYFPKTPFRIIVNPRYVDLLYEMYLEAELLGFRYFTFILDFETRPDVEPIPGKLIWQEKDTIILQEQINKIIQEIIYGFLNDIKKPQLVEMNKVFDFILNQKRFNVEDLPCQVFSGRTLLSIQSNGPEVYCMNKYYPDMEEAKKVITDAYNSLNHQCLKNKNCQAFEFCALYACPKNGLDKGQLFDFDNLECILNKVVYDGAIKLLAVSNEVCPDSQLYKEYINHFIKNKGEWS